MMAPGSWRCLRPALSPYGPSLLRVSAAVAASIAIAGCEPERVCIKTGLNVEMQSQYDVTLEMSITRPVYVETCEEWAPNPKASK